MHGEVARVNALNITANASENVALLTNTSRLLLLLLDKLLLEVVAEGLLALLSECRLPEHLGIDAWYRGYLHSLSVGVDSGFAFMELRRTGIQVCVD